MIKTIALFAALTSLVFLVSPAEAVFDEAAVRTLLENGQFEQAKATLEPEVKADRRNHKALYYLGFSYLFLNEPEPAIKNIRKAIKIEPGIAKYHYWLGQSYGLKLSSAGKLNQMRLAPKYRKALERTLELDPKYLQARISLTEYCLEAPGIVGGGIDKAYKHARIVIEEDEPRGRLLLARVYQADNKLVAAENEYLRVEQSHGDDPEFAGLYNNYGYLLLALDRPEEAITQFKRQTELLPDLANAFDSLGDGYRAAGKLDQALATYQKAVEIDPGFEASLKNIDEIEREIQRRRPG